METSNNIVYSTLLNRLIKYKYCSNKSYEYYKKKNNYLVIPSIIITSFCSISSFLSTSELLSTDVKNTFLLLVAILTSLSSLMQMLSSTCGYNIKYTAFLKAANGYDDLITLARFEIDFQNNLDFIKEIEQKILKIKEENNYCVPEWINSQYDLDKLIQKKELSKVNNINFYNTLDETTQLINDSNNFNN